MKQMPLNKSSVELLGLFFLFISIVYLSFYQIQENISIIKYLFGHSIGQLLENYRLYHENSQEFWIKTLSFHNGNTRAGWENAVFLVPLFLFCDVLGGLNLLFIYYFTTSCVLLFLVLFYLWMRNVWGKLEAFFAFIFLGFSSIFQEIVRGGNYDSASLLMAIILIRFLFHRIGIEDNKYFFKLGALTALSWYAYGPIRGLTIVSFIRTIYVRICKPHQAFLRTLVTFLVILIPGIIILLTQHNPHHGSIHQALIDKENIFDYEKGNINNILQVIKNNFSLFFHRLLGAREVLDFPMRWQPHAHFINPLLVLPMFLGLVNLLTSLSKPVNQLLIVSTGMIFIIPIFTSGGGFDEPRRAIFYVIPMYCLIGIGSKSIVDFLIERIKHKVVKVIAAIVLLLGIANFIKTEMNFINRHILSSERDLGIIAFSDQIKKLKDIRNFYYLENRSLYNGVRESELMKIIMQEGKKSFEVFRVKINDSIPRNNGPIYLARSPDISSDDFNQWLITNRFKEKLIIESPIKNLSRRATYVWVQWRAYIVPRPFRFYQLQ